MSDMPALMLREWAREEILEAISERYCDLMRQADGLTVQEQNTFRREHQRIAKLFKMSEQTTPRGAC